MNIYDAGQFGQLLKERRKKLHYTQAYLSEVTGFSASFISEVENGKPTAEIGRVIQLANSLGLDVRIEERP